MAGEPMTLEQALAYLKPADANNGTISLRAPKAREAVAVIAAEIAALQNRAFDDGARWMRERAADRVKDRAYLMEHGEEQAAVLRAASDLAALPLLPGGERNA